MRTAVRGKWFAFCCVAAMALLANAFLFPQVTLANTSTTQLLEQQYGEWLADLKTPQGELTILTSFEAVHPGGITRTRDLSGNPLLIFHQAWQILNQMSPEQRQRALRVGPGTRLTIRGYPKYQENTYPSENINEVRREIQRALTALSNIEQWPLNNLISDLQAIGSSRHATASTTQALLKLSPWLYSSSGQIHPEYKGPRERIFARLSQAIEAAPETELESRYRHIYAVYLKQLFVEAAQKNLLPPALEASLNSFHNRFMDGFLESKLQPINVRHTPRFLAMEEMPIIMALLRGVIGQDCADLAAAIYALAPEARVFVLRRSASLTARPIGYMFVVELSFQDQGTVPYILTVNGESMSWIEARLAQIAITKQYNSNSVFVPKALNAVNTYQMRIGLRNDLQTEGSHRIRLPRSWDLISQNLRPSLGNAYAQENLSDAVRVDFDDHEIALARSTQISQAPMRYNRRSPAELTLPTRAMMAASLTHMTRARPQAYETLLGVSELQVRAAKLLSTSSKFRPMQAGQIHFVAIQLSIAPVQVIALLSSEARVYTFEHLYKHNTDFFNPDQWRYLIQKEESAILSKSPDNYRANERAEVLRRSLALRLTLPSEFLTRDPWQEVNAHLQQQSHDTEAALLALTEVEEWMPETMAFVINILKTNLNSRNSSNTQSSIYWKVVAALFSRRTWPDVLAFNPEDLITLNSADTLHWLILISDLKNAAHWNPYVERAIALLLQRTDGLELQTLLFALRDRPQLPSAFETNVTALFTYSSPNAFEELRLLLQRHLDWSETLWDQLVTSLRSREFSLTERALRLLEIQSQWPKRVQDAFEYAQNKYQSPPYQFLVERVKSRFTLNAPIQTASSPIKPVSPKTCSVWKQDPTSNK